MGINCKRLFFAELSGGVPSLTMSHRSGELFLQLSQKVNVADRRWHNIKIINDGKASVNIDNPVEALFCVPSYPFQILPLFCRALLSTSLSPFLQQQGLKFVSSGVPLVLEQWSRTRPGEVQPYFEAGPAIFCVLWSCLLLRLHSCDNPGAKRFLDWWSEISLISLIREILPRQVGLDMQHKGDRYAFV